MKEKATIASPGRRDFFRKAGLGVGLVGVAAATGGRAEAAEVAGEKAGENAGGYRKTEHVKRFYASARF